MPSEGRPTESKAPAGAALLLGALGVVYGDIGTSPLYAVQTVFSGSAIRPVAVEETSIYGVVSLIFWTVTVMVSVMYLILFMRADNEGEGGLLSLVALLQRRPLSGKLLIMLSTLAVFGAALFFGDSMITPAISVLSAMEGLEIIDPGLESIVVPGAVAILVVLFAFQRKGTAKVGRFFGPIMLVWFTAIALCGIRGIAKHPEVLQALSPHWAIRYFAEEPLTAFLSLGGVVLAITGAEALYADMGHFGREPIRRAWFLLVFPALILNYLGQGAFLIDDPSGATNPFFLLVPEWAQIPMVALATMATIIASQAVISGAFSVARQATRLGYLPRLRVIHTSGKSEGQIYLPFVNWLLMGAVLALVIGFQSSEKLAAAYGVAVIGTIAITTTLFFVYESTRHGRGPRVLLPAAFFLGYVLAFLLANLIKVEEGGWLPIGIGLVIFTVLTTLAPGARSGRRLPQQGRAPAAGVRRRSARQGDPGQARARLRRVPLTRRGHHAAGAAGQRRPQPLAPRARDHPDPEDAARGARPPRGPDRGLGPGLPRRRHQPRDRDLRLRRHRQPSRDPAPGPGGRPRGRQDRRRLGQLLRVGARAAGSPTAPAWPRGASTCSWPRRG